MLARIRRAGVGFGLGGLARIVAAAVMLSPQVAQADVMRLAVADGDVVFADALTTTLEPWSIEVVQVADAGDVDIVSALRVAHDAQAGAVVWVSEMGGEHVLWVYDVEDERVVARRIVAPPPFDEPTAAAVALSVKTLLRHSAVAPSAERFGYTPPKESPFVSDPPPPPPLPPNLFVEVSGGARFRTIADSTVESTYGIAVFWGPRALGGRYGVVGGIRGGAGVAVDSAELIGTYRENTLFGGAAVKLPIGPLSLGWSLTADLHYTRLDGLVIVADQTASAARINPGLRGRMSARARLGEAELGVAVDVERLLRGQRYLVFGQPVLETPDAALSILISLALPFQ